MNGNVINDYTKRFKKINVQEIIYSKITKKTFVGLCGPNPIEYLKKIKSSRFKKITLYELDKNIYEKAKLALKNNYPHVILVNDDINKHLGKTKAFYDLDYCKSFEDIRKYIPKIKDIEEFSMTLSLRPYGFPYKAFTNYLGHNNYFHLTYRDGNPMISIFVSKITNYEL